MAGLLRNFITLLWALPHYGRQSLPALITRRFLVTPLDAGSHRLKSDRYLQLAECAQLDLIIRSGLLWRMLKSRYSFVNAAQQLHFERPVTVFAIVQVDTQVLWFDERWVYFQHDFQSNGERHARLLVKMKFKHGRKTIDPSRLLGEPSGARPAMLAAWDASLAALSER